MRQDVVKIIQDFEEKDDVLFAQLDEATWVLVPKLSGCPLVFLDMGESVAIRTGFDVEVNVDYEEEGSGQLIYEIILALMNGSSVETLSGVYRNRLAPSGYNVEYPSGAMREYGDGKKTYTVRLPPWNKIR